MQARLRLAQFGVSRTIRVCVSGVLLIFGLALLAPNANGFGFVDFDQPSGTQSLPTRPIRVVNIDRAIDTVTERFLLRQMGEALETSSALVIRLNTPGGSLESTRNIVSEMLAARKPIVVWVAPAGAQAASAGTFIGAAAHVLAMSSGTNIGAASAVSITGDELGETLQRKANEDAAALMRSLATERGRDVATLDALEATVFDATAYTAQEALDLGIADVIADDLVSLQEQIHGFTVVVQGRPYSLHTSGRWTEEVQLGMLERFLTVIANPSLAFLFISLGGIGLIVELWNFGTWIPGILGVIFLILGFTGVGQLSFEWAGIALIAVALVLLTLELTLAPGLGVFGIAGVIVLITGGLFLFPVWDTPDLPGAPGIVNRWLLGGTGMVMLGAVLLLVREIRMQSDAVPYATPGASKLVVGQVAQVVTPLTPTGSVRVAGEVWSAVSESGDVAEDEEVIIESVDGIILMVRRVEAEATEDESPRE